MLICIIHLLLHYVDLLGGFSSFLVWALRSWIFKLLSDYVHFRAVQMPSRAGSAAYDGTARWCGTSYLHIPVFPGMSSIGCRLSRRVSLNFQTLGHCFLAVFLLVSICFHCPQSTRAQYSRTCGDCLYGPAWATEAQGLCAS